LVPDTSSGGNPRPQLSSQDPGKVNETSINKAKGAQEEVSEPTSAADSQLAKPKPEHEEMAPSNKTTPVTDKLTANSSVHNHSETIVDITKQNSAVDKQANLTEQIHAKNNHHSDAVTGLNTTSSHNTSTKAISEDGKHEGILKNATHVKSETTTAPISENKASTVVEMPNKEAQNKDVDNREHALPTEKKYNKSQNTDSAYNVPNDDDHEWSEDYTSSKCCTYCLYLCICESSLFLIQALVLYSIH
jgi:hypothetical protein